MGFDDSWPTRPGERMASPAASGVHMRRELWSATTGDNAQI